MPCSTGQQDVAERIGRPDAAASALGSTQASTAIGRRAQRTRRDMVDDGLCRFLDDGAWELDADLRDCARLVRQSYILAGELNPPAQIELRGASTTTADDSATVRAEHSPMSETPRRGASAVRGSRAKRRAPTPLTYSALASGAIVLITGLTCLTLAVAGRRPDWWNPGLPLSLLGQAALTMGIVLQIEDLRPRVRRTSS